MKRWNANKSRHEIPIYIHYLAKIKQTHKQKKPLITSSVSKDMGQLELSIIAKRNVNWNQFGNQFLWFLFVCLWRISRDLWPLQSGHRCWSWTPFSLFLGLPITILLWSGFFDSVTSYFLVHFLFLLVYVVCDTFLRKYPRFWVFLEFWWHFSIVFQYLALLLINLEPFSFLFHRIRELERNNHQKL